MCDKALKLATSLGLAVWLVSGAAPAPDSPYDAADLGRLTQILDLVRDNYAGDIGVEQLVEGAIEGVMERLDGQSRYLDPAALDELRSGTSGGYEGIGVGLGARVLRSVVWALDALVSILLNLVAAKPISIFVWWLYAGANRTTFHGRAELSRRVERARMAGRPVLFASNHLSMFDDPVVPMALFGTGSRAAAELSFLVILLILWRVIPTVAIRPEVFVVSVIAYAVGVAALGARKTWWSIGDLINFSGSHDFPLD